jgi:Protein of unknown function (DUF2971)
MPLSEFASSLYAAVPDTRLYHYTSIDALLQIVPSRSLWGTDIHYLNDSSELRHACERFLAEVRQLQGDPSQDQVLLAQLSEWLRDRLANGHMLFIVCFTEDGDLLSQWRGYAPHAKGVSIGFAHMHLLECAREQAFAFGRCIYDRVVQEEVSRQAIRRVLKAAQTRGPAPPSEAHPTQSYHPAFQDAEPHLLRIAALFKHDAFEAEREWRAVSPGVSDFVNTEVLYRAGKTTLVPYQPLRLNLRNQTTIGVEHAVLGPTPHVELGVQALSQFLSMHRVSAGPRRTSPSRVPYRET